MKSIKLLSSTSSHGRRNSGPGFGFRLTLIATCLTLSIPASASADDDALPIDLAAIRFTTEALVEVDAQGQRRFLAPDAAPFPGELLREPFETAQRTTGERSEASDLFIVQAAAPRLQIALREQLEDLGVRILGYIPHYAYLVRLDPARHAALSESSEVSWLGLYQPAWRIAPKLNAAVRAEPDRRQRFTALFEPDSFADASTLSQAAGNTGLTVLDAAYRPRGWKVRLEGPATAIHALATMNGCLWIEPFIGYELHNNVARSSTIIATARGGAAGPLMDVEDVWARGIRGEGQIAAISDSGLSTGDFATLHEDFGKQHSATNPLRVIKAYALGRATWDDNQTLGGGHGTHVAGSLVGNGFGSGADPSSNDFPTTSYAGTAPKARLVFQSILDSVGNLGGIPADLNDLFLPAYLDGARVHSNSWGTPLSGFYSTDSQEVDEFTWNHKDMLITYTAGNSSIDQSPADGVIDPDAIGAPGTAKNNVTVGASENYRPGFVYEFPEGDCTSSDGVEQKTWGWFSSSNFSQPPIFGDLMADDASGLGAFSSRGPTDDGRFKPDVVAPGIAIISTRTDHFQGYEQWGTCEVPVPLRPLYQTNGGTSMANPLTAGAAVLVRQYYQDGWHAEGSRFTREVPEPVDGFSPSSALVKATLLNGAWDMSPGQYGGGSDQEVPPGWDTGNTVPNNAQGFGRVDLESALFPGSGYGHHPDRLLEVHDIAPGLASLQNDSYSIPVASSAGPLTITLVWTDPYAAAGAGTKLVNDLDLIVSSPTAVSYYPNGVDRTVGAADTLNNVEQTRITSPTPGNWTITVAGTSVPGNGEPGTTVQPYALVISGVLATPCAVPTAPTGLTATPVASNRIDLSWNATASDSYSVYRATSPGGPYSRLSSGLTATSFSDTSVSGGTTYYYTITAVDAPGCESAYSSEVSAEVFGDCTLTPGFPGLTSALPTSTGGSCGMRLTWAAGSSNCPGGPLVYNVYRSTTPGFTPGPANLLASCVTDLFHDDTTAVSGTEYHYIVRAEDAALGGGGPCRDGNTDSGTLELSATAGGDGTLLLFADDFDGGQSPGDLWQFPAGNANPYVSGTCAPPPTGTGPVTYATDWYRPETGMCSGNTLASNDGAADPAYSDRNDGRAVLGLPGAGGGLVLPATATAVTLRFDHDYDFDTTTRTWDGGRLLISVGNNSFAPITPITPVGGYPGTVFNTTAFCHPFPGAPAYVDDSIGCIPASFDLTAYAGQRIWLAWNHGSDRFATVDDGWAIDNVRLEATMPGSCNPAPEAVQFLTATATDSRIDVEWLNPTVGYDSTIIRYRTDTFPTDPGDGTLLVDQAGPPAGHDSATHTSLANGTTYYYAAFVDNGSGEFSAARTVSARPFDTSGDVKWAYSAGASALAPPGIGSAYGVANDRVLHSMTSAPGNGTWPAGWTPMAMNAPSQARPPIVPINLGAATKVAFVGSQDGRVYAVDANAGHQLWASPDLGGMVQAAPAGIYTAVGGAYDLILVGTRNSGGDSAFHGLNLADGTVAWTYDNGGGASGIGIVSSGASVDWANQRVYFASRAKPGGSDHTVWCLSFTDTGAGLLWSRALGDVDGSPILHGGRIYVGTNGSEVHALDAADGSDLWTAPFDAADGPVKGYVWPRFGTSQLIFATHTTIWSITDGGASASLNWSETGVPGPSLPLVSLSAPWVWAGGSDGSFYQLDISGPAPTVSSVVLGSGAAAIGSPARDTTTGVAYVGSDEGRMYAVQVPFSGALVQTPPAETLPIASPALESASAVGPADQEAAARAVRCARVKVRSRQSDNRRRFSATGILDLDFKVRFRRLPEGDHLLRLRILTPNGHLYQELTQPFTTDATARGVSRRVDGFPRPLSVAVIDPAGARATLPKLKVRWPVAGTPIVHSSLYGTWTVEAYVDDSPQTCGRSATFRIED